MVQIACTRAVLAIGGAALCLTAAAGVAFADPGMDAVINTTCSYPQAVAALNAQAPDAAKQFSAAPAAQSWLQSFLASPVNQRKVMAQQAQALPGAQQYLGLVVQIANTCNNY